MFKKDCALESTLACIEIKKTCTRTLIRINVFF